MKYLLLILVVLMPGFAFAQGPVLRQGFTTNLEPVTYTGRVFTTNTSNSYGAQHLQFVNTNLVTGSGTVSAVINGHLWTNSGTGFANLQIGNLFLRGTFQVSVCEVLSSSVIRTVEPADQTYSGATWTYYSNYTDIYDSVPRWVGGILSDGGYWGRSGDFVNSGKYWMGGGRTVGAWDIATNYGNFGPFMRFLVLGTDDTFKVPVFLGLNSPNNSFAVMNDGYVMIGTGISNIANAAIAIKVPLTFSLQTASTPVMLDASKNLVSGTISTIAAAFPPINLAATTNVDCSTAYMFFRSTTNVAIPFQLTNEVSGVSYEIQLFNVGATANTVTLTASTGHTLSTPNVTAAQSLTFGTPTANSCLRILITCNGNTNRVDFMDNYK